jgi:hypothetical protein
MRKPFVLTVLAILLAALILFRASDAAISVADTSTFNNRVADSVSGADNSSASTTITITMTGIAGE